MKHLFSLFLVIFLFSSVLLFTISCAPTEDGSKNEDPKSDPAEDPVSDDSKIYVPPFKLYEDRRATKLSAISYRAPDTDALLLAVTDAATALTENSLSEDAQVEKVKGLANAYSEAITMSAYLAWKVESGETDATVLSEYARLSEARPLLIRRIETLCVAAARSPHAARLAAECFSENLSGYAGGERYTDEAVDAMVREVKKENEYLLLSESNVTITYEGETDTAEHLIARCRERLGEDSTEFLAAKAVCTTLYRTAKLAREKELYLELVALRREIADALGASSYAEIAYRDAGYSYTQKEADALFSDVAQNAVSVYRVLYDEIFLSRENSTVQTQKIYKTINRLSSLYGDKGGVLSEAYNYMLQYSLYDIAVADGKRNTGNEVFYLDSYDSPLLYLTAEEKVTDYLSMAHAFGNYLGAYRYGDARSAELVEFHAAACEFLTLRLMKGQVTEDTYTTLLYTSMQNALLDLIDSAFLAAAEAEIYALPKDGITEEAVNAIVAETARRFGLSENVNNLSYLLCDEIVRTPFAAQSRVSAKLAALELFFAEAETPDFGWQTYLSLLSKDSNANTLTKAVAEAKLTSPLATGHVKSMVCKIFYELYGANFNEAKTNNSCNAA